MDQPIQPRTYKPRVKPCSNNPRKRVDGPYWLTMENGAQLYSLSLEGVLKFYKQVKDEAK